MLVSSLVQLRHKIRRIMPVIYSRFIGIVKEGHAKHDNRYREEVENSQGESEYRTGPDTGASRFLKG